MPKTPNIRLDLLLALAAHWRSQGEYWSGTPEDSRSQSCADDLLKVLGLSKNAHTLAGTEYGCLLKAHGVQAHTEPKDRGNADSAHLEFLDGPAEALAKETVAFIDVKAATDKPYRVSIIHEKLGWAFERGYRDGFQDGAQARKMRYKRPSKTPKR